METNKDLIKQFYESYEESLKEIKNHNAFPEYFYDLFLAGNNTIYQKNITETKTFDEEWIRTVESYFPSLNKIALDPKSVLRYDEEVVAVEKARKVNSQSIRHLASNTHNIKEVTSEMVIPKKILTTFAEVEYGTYENRMVMTLIDKLYQFVRNRYEIIKNNVESYQKKHFNLTSDFKINNTDAHIKIDVVLKEDLDNKSVNEYNINLLKRVEQLDKLVTSLKMSNFMKMMEGKKKVYPPIMKSNIIVKNVDYKNAYMLWLFLDRYNTLAFDISIEEKDLTFDNNYLEDIYQTALINFATVAYNQANRNELYDLIESKKFKKKSVKVLKRNIEDFIEHPQPIDVEDQAINQYYLEKFKDYFKKSVEYHELQTKTYETSLKRALKDTLNITNSLYQSFFELNEEEDIFKKLIKENDPVLELKDAKEKALIAKLIREVKEVDYNNAIRQEKKLLTKIASFDNKLIKASKENKLITAKKIRSVEKLKLEKQKALKLKKILDDKLELNKKNDLEIQELRKTIYLEINKIERDLAKEQELEIQKLKLELTDKHEKEMNDLRKEHEVLVNKLKESKKLEEQKLKLEKQEKLKEAKLKQQEKLKQEKALLREKELAKLKREKEKLTKALRQEKEKSKLKK